MRYIIIYSKIFNKQSEEAIKINTDRVRHIYNRIADYYDIVDRFIPQALRAKALTKVRGRILEVGIGTGANLRYYHSDCDITGVDLSSEMLKKARVKANDLALNVTLYEMDIQNLQFADESFDTVVSTCVFCTVPDPKAALLELRRVCKRDGQLIFVEHVKSKNRFWGKVMDLVNPITVSLVGCNINRETVDNIKNAGFKIHHEEGRIFKYITIFRN